MSHEEDNNEFLQKFFRENNLFDANKNNISSQYSEANATHPEKKIIPPPQSIYKKKTISLSQKDINLKNLFSKIEQEKNQHHKRVKEGIQNAQQKQNDLPSLVISTLQSQSRKSFEDFLAILPVIEKTALLHEREELPMRKSRNTEYYLPELWENEGSIIFKEIHDIPFAIDNSNEEPLKEREEDARAGVIPPVLSNTLSSQPEKKTLPTPLDTKKSHENDRKKTSYISKNPTKKSLVKKNSTSLPVTSPPLPKPQTQKNLQKREKIAPEKNINTVVSSRYNTAIQQYTHGKKALLKTLSKISSAATQFQQLRDEKRALQQSKQRVAKKKKEIAQKKTESHLFEWVKTMSMAAALFLVAMVGLNYSSFLDVTEKYWNATEYKAKQESLTKLVNQNSELTENKFAKIPALPVSGPRNKEQNTLDTKMYLNVSPPDTRIVIPSLGKNIPILEVSDNAREEENWKKLEKDIQGALHDGVVHYPGTAHPGQDGNVFITGHSSYYPWDDGKYKDVFAALHNLHEGDEYYIYYKGKKYQYKIYKRKVVRPSDVSVLEQDTSKKTSTLMTCTPIGTATNRLIIQSIQTRVGY